MTDYELALTIATKFHAGQKYGKEDYTVHLVSVANSLSSSSDERLQIIAVLHDILEDTACSLDVLYGLFEDNVVKAVEAITKTGCEETYEQYISKVRNNQLARVVKMHDTKCNLDESLKRLDMKRVLKYSKQMQLLAE
jgi:(p)ppGpp synthase/HD superfamily hydrolase